jgi:hypothetical protein
VKQDGHPGRRVPDALASWQVTLSADGFVLHSAAESVLLEFGGLIVGKSGPGIERARSVVHLDPINKVLVELGIRRSNSRLDEFDIVGLGRWRSTADLAEGAG